MKKDSEMPWGGATVRFFTAILQDLIVYGNSQYMWCQSLSLLHHTTKRDVLSLSIWQFNKRRHAIDLRLKRMMLMWIIVMLLNKIGKCTWFWFLLIRFYCIIINDTHIWCITLIMRFCLIILKYTLVTSQSLIEYIFMLHFCDIYP